MFNLSAQICVYVVLVKKKYFIFFSGNIGSWKFKLKNDLVVKKLI